MCKFVSENTKRPDVDFSRLFLLIDNLGSHPQFCTELGMCNVLLNCQLARDTEVSELDLTLHVVKNVVRFDVAMDNISFVNEF